MKESLTFIKKKITHNELNQYAFFPTGNFAYNKFQNFRADITHLIKIHTNNNIKYHRLLFAVARLIIDNLPENHFACNYTSYQMIKLIQLEIGDTDKIKMFNGEIIQVPRSIAFANMEDSEKKTIEKKLFEIAGKLLNVSEEEIKKNYQEYL